MSHRPRSTRMTSTAILALLLGLMIGPGPVAAASPAAASAPASVGQRGDRAGALSSSGNHACAVRYTGIVKCWGANLYGQLGDGTTVARLAPVTVLAGPGLTTSLSTVVAVAAGTFHTCALLSNGTVKCWGENGAGQLGDGTEANRTAPVTVIAGVGQTTPLTGVETIAAGRYHTCASLTNGTLKCWGRNANGQIGDGTLAGRMAPVTVISGPGSSDPLTGVTAAAAGNKHTCALLVAGTVKCWGFNVYGQIGDGSTTGQLTPTTVISGPGSTTALTTVTGLSVGATHTCALRAGGTAKCWGRNGGRLGDDTAVNRSAPVSVLSGPGSTNPLGGIRSITGGADHTCAVMAMGTARCWGSNAFGQLGDDTTTVRRTPVQVKAAPGNTAALTLVTGIVGGASHSCALRSNGAVKCWGNNASGQLGDDTGSSQLAPVSVVSAPGSTQPLMNIGPAAIAVGSTHTCALRTSGTVNCWGENDAGQVGDGTTADRHAPVSVIAEPGSTSPLTGAIAIAAGQDHSCALLVGGTVRCWGSNLYGELGDGTTTERHAPVQVIAAQGSTNPLSSVVAIAAGQDHTCALRASGTVACWGRNASGRLGDGTTTNRSAPVTVIASLGSTSSLTSVTALATGAHTCALRAGGTAKCWGSNGFGQVGDDSTSNRLAPVTVVAAAGSTSPLSNLTAISTGPEHTCAVRSLGTAKCWGRNTGGRLGDGTVTNRDAPVTVISATGNTNPLSNVSTVAAGAGHSCALRANGTLKCWGTNTYGQLGNDSASSNAAPVTVVSAVGSSSALTSVGAVSAGGNHTCALRAIGTLKCWGRNHVGQLGDGTVTNRLAPVTITLP